MRAWHLLVSMTQASFSSNSWVLAAAALKRSVSLEQAPLAPRRACYAQRRAGFDLPAPALLLGANLLEELAGGAAGPSHKYWVLQLEGSGSKLSFRVSCWRYRRLGTRSPEQTVQTRTGDIFFNCFSPLESYRCLEIKRTTAGGGHLFGTRRRRSFWVEPEAAGVSTPFFRLLAAEGCQTRWHRAGDVEAFLSTCWSSLPIWCLKSWLQFQWSQQGSLRVE